MLVQLLMAVFMVAYIGSWSYEFYHAEVGAWVLWGSLLSSQYAVLKELMSQEQPQDMHSQSRNREQRIMTMDV